MSENRGGYRDELAAAHARIADLEATLAEVRGRGSVRVEPPNAVSPAAALMAERARVVTVSRRSSRGLRVAFLLVFLFGTPFPALVLWANLGFLFLPLALALVSLCIGIGGAISRRMRERRRAIQRLWEIDAQLATLEGAPPKVRIGETEPRMTAEPEEAEADSRGELVIEERARPIHRA